MTRLNDRPAGPASLAGGAPLAFVLLAALALAPLPAAAQATAGSADRPEDRPFDGLLRALDLKARPSAAPDFVRRSRPASTDYIKPGLPHPERPVKVLTPAEIEAETAALDGARVAQQRRAGIKPAPVPLKPPRSAAATPKSKDR